MMMSGAHATFSSSFFLFNFFSFFYWHKIAYDSHTSGMRSHASHIYGYKNGYVCYAVHAIRIRRAYGTHASRIRPVLLR